jgi:hypothetical protein
MAKKSEATATATGKQQFEEWQVYRNMPVRIDGKVVTTFDKIKLLRPCVKVTKDQVESLNYGKIIHPDNRSFTLLLLPGEKVPTLEETLAGS